MEKADLRALLCNVWFCLNSNSNQDSIMLFKFTLDVFTHPFVTLEPSCVMFDFVWILTPTKTVMLFKFTLDVFTHPFVALSLTFRAQIVQ